MVVEYPSEFIFKSIFRNGHITVESLKKIFHDTGIDSVISEKQSRNGKFISYTITVHFRSEEEMADVCGKIKSLDGFMTMF